MAYGEAAQRVQLPRGDLICHAAPPTNLPRFTCLYSFLTQFSSQLLEAFWCSKWVMSGTVGNLEKSTFQRYKVRVNRSSDRKFMAPGSRVVRAVFRIFPMKISAKQGMLPANRELRLIAEIVVFLTYLSLWIKLQRARRNLRTKAAIREEKCVGFSICFPYFRQLSRAQ